MTESEIETLLSKQLIGRIGCHAEGTTYIVPISYAYQQDIVYAHIYEGMKLAIMRQNPNVCFEVDNTHDTSNWQSVIAWGTFEEVKDESERIEALEILTSRVLPLNSSITTHLGGAHWPFYKTDLKDIDGIVIRIHIFKKTGRYECSEEMHVYSY